MPWPGWGVLTPGYLLCCVVTFLSIGYVHLLVVFFFLIFFVAEMSICELPLGMLAELMAAPLSLFPSIAVSLVTWAEANSPALAAHHRRAVSLFSHTSGGVWHFPKPLIVPWAESTNLILAIFIPCAGQEHSPSLGRSNLRYPYKLGDESMEHREPTVPWAALKAVWSAGQERYLHLCSVL